MTRDLMILLPRLKFADTNGKYEQMKYLSGELEELYLAYYHEPDINRVAEEAADVMQAAMTLLWIIERDSGLHPLDVITRMIEKNKVRGYE
jgi:NTP pyrophosphatase (non-canonical NTP hydrolase)